MKITVEPKTVAGTNGGGEDLFLVFRAVGEPSDEFVVEPVSGDPSWDIEGDGDEDDPDNVWSCCTDHYEFEWRGTLRDLHKLASEVGVTDRSRWVWSGSVGGTPQAKFVSEHLVAGNAD